MKKQFTIFLILVFVFGLFIAMPSFAASCDFTKGIITSITPKILSTEFDDTITIEGSGFGEIQKMYSTGSTPDGNYGRFIIDNNSYKSNLSDRQLKVFGNYFGRGVIQEDNIISWSDGIIIVKGSVVTNDYNAKLQAIREGKDFTIKIEVDDFQLLGTQGNTKDVALIGTHYICSESSSVSSFKYNIWCTEDEWSCDNWGICQPDGKQTRSCNKINDCKLFDTASPATVQSCTPACLSNSWTCSEWGSCLQSGQQTRTCSKILNCEGGVLPPATIQSCIYIPPCTSSDWSCASWSSCSQNGSQTRICNKISNCQGGISSPATFQSCAYVPICTSYSWSCGDWGVCSPNGIKNRTCNKISNCDGGVPSPATTQSCTYIPICATNDWSCGSWGVCSSNGVQTRSCNKTSSCTGGSISPITTQTCTYTPACSADTWQCDSWGTCSPQGIQTRSCNKTFDCPSAETALPATSQYCVAPNQPKQQSPTEDLGIVNQDSIIKATVKLVCPISETMASQGSGTVINSSGTILTNKHVIDGTAGCWVGFIDNYNSEPYFGDRQIADIYKLSSDADVAVLKLRNPNNKILTSIDITKGNSGLLGLGDKITTYGYPAKFGTKITYTSGDFSGVDGNYLKTTAIIEHGNSGGGAYLKNGTFIGIPSAVVKGSLNSMGYLLSVNKVNSWLNNSAMAYNNNSNNNYSRVSSILSNFDLNALGSLNLYTESNSVNIPDGALIRAVGDPDVFIIKYIGDKKFKRLVLSPLVFKSYGHLKWENVMVVDKSVVDSFTTSDLVRAAGDKKVYKLSTSGDTGQKRWIKTSAAFAKFGLDWDSIYEINSFDRGSYAAGAILE